MKNIIVFVLILVTVLAGYFYFKPKVKEDKNDAQIYKTFSSSELGIEFQYRDGQDGSVIDGYTLDLIDSDDFNSKELVKTIILIPVSELSNNLKNSPVPTEGPPTITIYVVKNLNKEWPAVWAPKNKIFTNMNLQIGELKEDVIGGANAIRYFADGLYRSENVVVAHGENMYVISGMYMDENSLLRKDFEPLLRSIKFIQSPGQE